MRERCRKELSETLRNLNVDHRNPDVWMEAAFLYMALGNPERAAQCTRASVQVEVERREDGEVAARLADQLRQELSPQETVPCPDCSTLLESGSVLCQGCGLDLNKHAGTLEDRGA